MTKPMDLPEIRNHVALFMDRAQLGAAACVCKTWRETFTPHLYHTLYWNKQSPGTLQYYLDSILLNADYIRHLELQVEPFLENGFPLDVFKRIDTLVVKFDVQRDTPIFSRLAAIIRENPDLTNLVLELNNGYFPEDLLDAMGSSPKLTNFTITYGGCSPEGFTTFLSKVSDRVEMLNLEKFKIGASSDVVSRGTYQRDDGSSVRFLLPKEFPHLRYLDLELPMDLSTQLAFVERSPNLKSLNFCLSEAYKAFPTKDLCRILSSKCLLVEGMYLSYPSPEPDNPDECAPCLTDRELSTIIDNCPSNLIRFSADKISFGPMAYKTLLKRHSSSLKHITLTEKSLTSGMVQEILVSCPQLKSFDTDSLNSRDIIGVNEDSEVIDEPLAIQPQEWVTSNLEYLQVRLCDLGDKPLYWHRAVFKQLSKLKALRVLDISGRLSQDDSKEGLKMRLEAGLDELKTLTQLREITFCTHIQDMDEEDIRWMLQAWPKLKRVRGSVHSDSDKRRRLEALLIERKIEVADRY
ncbi:hypothetical protein BGZ76_000501 [Entomortierella beljakovae]|nr:hypothetical protein BGZ76_000501 [Entomortierella beljakovae]